MQKVFVFLAITALLFTASPVFARSGCCSHHDGVRADGCGCNDGTPLSSTCAPYYTCTANTYTAPVVQTEEIIPTDTPIPTFIPTPTFTPTPKPTVKPKPTKKPVKKQVKKHSKPKPTPHKNWLQMLLHL